MAARASLREAGYAKSQIPTWIEAQIPPWIMKPGGPTPSEEALEEGEPSEDPVDPADPAGGACSRPCRVIRALRRYTGKGRP